MLTERRSGTERQRVQVASDEPVPWVVAVIHRIADEGSRQVTVRDATVVFATSGHGAIELAASHAGDWVLGVGSLKDAEWRAARLSSLPVVVL